MVNEILVKIIIVFSIFVIGEQKKRLSSCILTLPLASICSAAYTYPPHLGQPSPAGALAIALGRSGALDTTKSSL